jgi:alpha-beta hydrolase superfamily lysophospholipase
MTAIVFIHGMYVNGQSWQPWVDRVTPRGYTCHTPSWPYHDGEPAALRAAIDPGLGRLTFGAVVAHLKSFVDQLTEKPVLIGHSVGGLVVQKLINDGYGTAGVAITPAPPPGVISFSPHFIPANFPHVNPFAGNRPVIMTKRRFHYTFCNTMSRAESDEAFESYVVPESRNVPRRGSLTRQGSIDFRAPHAPLLIMAADRDHLCPPGMVTRNARAYKGADSVVDHHEFAGRSHFICNQAGWEEVADYALDWLTAAGV